MCVLGPLEISIFFIITIYVQVNVEKTCLAPVVANPPCAYSTTRQDPFICHPPLYITVLFTNSALWAELV